MAFTSMTNPPPLRDPSIPYDDVAPGLYPDETAVELDDGEHVAVSISATRSTQDGGLLMTAWARWINANGSTKIDSAQQEVETSYRHRFDPAWVARFGVNGLSSLVLRMMMGETDVGDLQLTEQVRLNASIRQAISVTKATQQAVNPAAVLF